MRMWGINPDSQRWQDMMRDFERGQTVFNQVLAYPLSSRNTETLSP